MRASTTIAALFLAALGLGVLACAAPEKSVRGRSVSDVLDGGTGGTSQLARSAPSGLQPRAATLLITDPGTLEALEARGLRLADVLGGPATGAADNRTLSRLPSFGTLSDVLRQEAERAASNDKLAGVDVGRFAHRLFDVRFLSSEKARFQLAGIVNRLDRAPFAPGSCGETRLIYRLSYLHDVERASKLPMTLGIELAVPRPPGGCRAVATRWVEPERAAEQRGNTASTEKRADWLRSAAGPLALELMALTPRSGRVVVNLQLVRWPASMRPDLGGHAEYLLRSFRLDERGVLRPELLENTVNGAALAGRPTLRKELVDWIRSEAGAAAIDAGSPILPAALLTERSISVTPRGLARLANRPFSSALSVRDFVGLDWSKGSFVKSPEGLRRRLDQLSCPGCHEARSVAGFHLLGEDTPGSPLENALASPVSAHVTEDLPRRARLVQQVLDGAELAVVAPFAERPNPDSGSYGAHCGLGEDASFAAWSCDKGLHCSEIEAAPESPVGQCLPEVPRVGDACEKGSVASHQDGRRDRMRRVSVEPCEGSVCNRSGVGFPGGMCTASCGDAGSACGSIAILDPFNACLARGASFISCLRGNVRPAGLRGCDAQHPCRDDYVCARAKSGGVCLPPYFVFQLRVDGHSSVPR